MHNSDSEPAKLEADADDVSTQSSATSFEQAAEEEELGLFAEFWLFLKENKAWWLVPILLALILIGVIAVAAGSVAAPFIYPLF